MFPPQGVAGGAAVAVVPRINYSIARVTLGDGETIVIARFTNPAGKLIKIWKAQITDDTGASVINLSIEAYNNTDNVSIYSTESNIVQEGEPLASGGEGDDVEIRIKNASGGTVDCQGFLAVTIE